MRRIPDVHYIATGNLIRAAMRQAGAKSDEWQRLIAHGLLVSSSDIEQLVQQGLDGISTASTVVFDGYPRLPEQAARIHHLVGTSRVTSVVYLSVCPSTLMRRAMHRVICSACYAAHADRAVCSCGSPTKRREDDDPEVVRERVRSFYQNLPAIIGNLIQVDRFVSVRADSAPTRIVDQIIKALMSSD